MSFDIDTTNSSPDRGDSAITGFASPAPAPTNVSGMMGATREMSEVQAAMTVAQARPRDQQAAVDRIMMACGRPGLAETALYQYARGGSDITGPSIRLAEALAQAWGNLSFGIRELEQRGGESTVEAFAWDLETNVRQAKTFQVPHVRYTRRGAYDLEDPRDIYELVANQGARRVRACILGILPGDVVEAAVKACEETQRANVTVTPELTAKLVEAFAEFDVSKEQIEARIQRRLEAMTPGLVIQLRKIHTSLKDGMSAPADWFEPEDGADAAAEPKSIDELKATIAKSQGNREPENAAPAEADATEAVEPDQVRVEWLATIEDQLAHLPDDDAAELAKRHFPDGLAALTTGQLEALSKALEESIG